eukprot:SM000064S19823  [mRNA]  locus=s64:532304:533521:- [translate_table: standard]
MVGSGRSDGLGLHWPLRRSQATLASRPGDCGRLGPSSALLLIPSCQNCPRAALPSGVVAPVVTRQEGPRSQRALPPGDSAAGRARLGDTRLATKHCDLDSKQERPRSRASSPRPPARRCAPTLLSCLRTQASQRHHGEDASRMPSLVYCPGATTMRTAAQRPVGLPPTLPSRRSARTSCQNSVRAQDPVTVTRGIRLNTQGDIQLSTGTVMSSYLLEWGKVAQLSTRTG